LVKVSTPLILVNFKAYLESTGRKALQLAEMAEKVTLETEVCIGVAPQLADIPLIVRETSIPVFAQHIDPVSPGRFTGHVLAESVREAGAVGTLLNHSEKQLKLSEINVAVSRARENGLISVVCANNSRVASAAAALQPEMVAVEPPELIETGISVSKAAPEVISGAVELVKKINPDVVVLCGAGVMNGEDVAAALRLGSEGVLVASGVVKAKDPYKVMMEFAEAIMKV